MLDAETTNAVQAPAQNLMVQNAKPINKGKFSSKKPFAKGGAITRPKLQRPLSTQANQVIKMRDDPIHREAIFAPTTTVREIDPIVRFNNNYAVLLRMPSQMMTIFRTHNPKMSYSINIEALNYYTTGLLWLRLIEQRNCAQRVLTPEEVALRRLTEHVVYSIPEPIYLYLKAIGDVKTSTGQHLHPESPPLPVRVVNGIGGLFGPVQVADGVEAIQLLNTLHLG